MHNDGDPAATAESVRCRARTRSVVPCAVVTLGAVVVLVAASCTNLRMTTAGNDLGCAIERDGVLPEGAEWRSSWESRTVSIFGVTDLASQDRVVEGARESLRRMGGTRGFEFLKVEFWSGDPPPREVLISNKPPAPRLGDRPPDEAGALNAPYAIRLLRTAEIRDAGPHRVVAPRIEDVRAAVGTDVRTSGVVPPHGVVAWTESTLFVYRVEDPSAQDAILAVVRDARARRASSNMEAVFKQVVFERLDVTYAPDGRMSAEAVAIRTVTLD